MTEADTCRTYVVPKLHNAGWSDDRIREQISFTDGRIIPLGASHARKERKRADYVLRYRPDFPTAIVEAKAEYKNPGDGLQVKVDELRRLQAATQKELDALMPSILAKAFAGKL